ncbi:choice-of-anchor F family protein [Emcibacter nanhaiensis]|uniref:Choice-of-anchor F family protein n=1 Tax=Emcibacter nanhaiensis TaxID=1505037 RepID=A0A501PHW6_9PROT|nr:choice-of-anchor F family protein [Emcibacter nanhaiensis]TPD59436.1 choice-of-anchor F family protein [Emcibacter nanhaiensis]
MKAKFLVIAATALTTLSGASAFAGTITDWNTDNVDVPAGPYIDDVTYYSTIYDQDVTGGTAGATTNGRIAFTPPEASGPGITVINNEPYPGEGNAIPDCIIASGGAACQDPFQSGKRYKLQITDTGAIDLVFNVSEDAEVNSYRVFQKIINATGGRLEGFDIQLGFNIGDEFVQSTAGDGLGFDLAEGSQANFPFGLFGDADTNQHHDLDGFFDNDARAGFLTSLTEDELSSTGLFGVYEEMFGDWLALSMVPEGYFWDHDGDPETDAILMAWLNADGEWEMRRAEDGSEAVPTAPTIVTEQDLIDAGYELGVIEDLANVNTDFYISVGDISSWLTYDVSPLAQIGEASFTLRLVAREVPAPAALGLMGLGLGLFGWRRRKSA